MRFKAFGIIFLIAYGIVGLLSILAVRISWTETADIWDKFREYVKIAVLERAATKVVFSFFAALVIETAFTLSRRLRRII